MNFKNTLLTLLVIIAFWQITSCYYDVEQELYPKGSTATCDTTNVKLSDQVSTTFKTYCLSCHSTAAAGPSGGGIILDTYEGVKAQVDNGRLHLSINQLPGASSMPKGANKIPDCDIAKIEAWINAGALDN
ncbi:MAG: hypothetical protein GC181_00945 [Bacteroidetes bacterium]|nr:hypothetical protein [Bacteroidota bacterium]